MSFRPFTSESYAQADRPEAWRDVLSAVGLPELITHSLEEYEALALALARDPGRLAAVRQKLMRNRETCALFDTGRFTRDIEAAYAAMWERCQCGEPPQSFAVTGAGS